MKNIYSTPENCLRLMIRLQKAYHYLLVLLLFLTGQFLNAQTLGPNNPGTGTNLNTTGTLAWTNPGNIVNTADLNYATTVFTGSSTTNYLEGTNYGFAIPTGAIVNGIVVTISRKTSIANGGRVTKDNIVSLVKNGVITGNNKASATSYTTSFVTATYGSVTDTWGTTWTPANINATNFGAVLSVSANNNLTATVDFIKITIHYTTIGFSPSSACTGSAASVVITGNNLISTSAVSFNGTATSFVQNSNTQVTATLPAGATTGTISLTTPSGTGTSASSFTVNPLPTVAAITGTTSVCIGSTTALSDATSGGTWSSASPLKATINTSGVVLGVAAGTSLITYSYTDSNGCSNSVNTTVTVNALPVVSAPSTVCIGSTIQLSPATGGTWLSSDNTKATVDNTGLVNGIALGSPTFSFTDANNCSATTSSVNVLSLPAISGHPVVSQTICSSGSVSFSVTATGSGITYQWYNGITPLANGGAISGANTATLAINPVSLSDASTNYNCVVSGSCVPSVTSNNAELIVIEKVTITSQPAATQTYCTGNTVNFSVTATGAGLTYQWYNGATALVDSATIAGATTSSLSISSLALADASNNYYCLVTGTSPCSAVASSYSILNVNQSASVTSQPAITQTVCEGTSVSFSVSGTGGSLIYQWYKGASPLSNGGAISGASSTTLTINPVSLSDAATDYYCIINNGCSSGVTSDNAELIVNPKAFIPNQTLTVCNQNGFTITPTDGVPNAGTIVPASTTYSWSAPSVTGGLTGGTAQSGQTFISGNLTNPTNSNQTATYTVTPSTGASPNCNGATFTVTVTVKPNATISNQTTTACSTNSFTFTPTSGGGNIIPSGTLYSWGLPIVTGGITGAATGSGQVSLIQTLTNPTGIAQTATYTITTDSNGCAGSTFTLTVTVNPKPIAAVNIASQTTCSGVAFSNITLSNSINSTTTYNWTRDNTTNVTGTTSGTSGTIVAGGSFSLSNSLTNITTVAQTVIYTFTPVSNGCSGDTVTSTVIVSAPSTGGAVTSSLPGVLPAVSNITECHFATGTLYLSNHVGNVVRWEYTTTGGLTWIPVANTTTTYTYTNIVVSTFFRAVIQNGASCSIVNSSTTLVNVVPNVKPSPVTATPSTICAGNSSDLFSQSGYATSALLQAGGSFSNANPANWLVDGCGNCLSAGSSNTNPGPFQLSATNGGTYSGINYTSTGKFAIANGNFNSVMETPVFNTFGLTTASLTFNHAFNLQAGAWAAVELSLDGGATYTIVLAQYNGPSTRTPYTAFPLTSIDLSNYIGQANLKIRFNYHGTVNSSWAIDNIQIPEAPANLTTEWIDSSTGQVISTSATVTVTPAVTTTYAIVSHLNGCTSFGPDGTSYVTVTVNQRPTASIGPNQTICNGGTATFSVALTGVGPWSITYSNGTTTTTVNNVNTNPYVFSVSGITTNKTYTITALSDSRCTAKAQDLTGSAVVTVLNGTAGLWTGLVSTDWFDCKNWAGGLPSATVNAQIPAGATRMPLIDPATSSYAALYSNIASAQDVIIANTATLTMGTNSNLYVSRDWKNNGVFTPGQGTVTFNGATVNQIQTINLGIRTKESYYNLILNTSNSAKGVSLVDGFELTVANLLTLQSGDIRLTGEAQIVQAGLVGNPTTGTGKIYRDQQGTKSSFNYNYWSSPVSNNGIDYTVADVLRDGTDVTTNPFSPTNITFGNPYNFADGAVTNPIKLSSYWMYKYTSVSTTYAAWQSLGSAGTVKIGEGFTMKGTDGIAPLSDTQNYVFAGKPNNGSITLNISPNQTYLVGNPYPSALDADEFIKDNIKDGAGRNTTNVINGALYFWNHFGGHSHYVGQYIGGYATYTLMGGVNAISNDVLVNNNGASGTLIARRYIPVGQGFFVGTTLAASLVANNPNLSTAITGGPILFKNSQRAFKVESSTNSVFMRAQSNSVAATDTEEDLRPKIKLRFDTPTGLHRQLLVGADSFATDLFDLGYDAPIADVNANDMYWDVSESKFVIQAIANFNSDRVIPFTIKITNPGVVTIKIDALENIPEATEIYLYDNQTGIYHNLKNDSFSITLSAGIHNKRFSLRFAAESLKIAKNVANSGIAISFANNNNSLNISNNNSKTTIEKVYLFNLLGQRIASWDVENQTNLQIPIQKISQGTYIVKVKTSNGVTSSKIIID